MDHWLWLGICIFYSWILYLNKSVENNSSLEKVDLYCNYYLVIDIKFIVYFNLYIKHCWEIETNLSEENY